MVTTHPILDITVITGDSTAEEIREALAVCNAAAKRMQTRDGLSKLNPRHGDAHRFLSYLVELLLEVEKKSRTGD